MSIAITESEVLLMSQLLVEVSATDSYGENLTPAKPQEFMGKAKDIADAIVEVARDLGRHLNQSMKAGSADGPFEVTSLEVGFGVTVQSEASILVVKASGQATFNAKVTWTAKQ